MNDYKIPKEGDVREDKGKKFVWTKRTAGDTCTIYEWIEQYEQVSIDYSGWDYLG